MQEGLQRLDKACEGLKMLGSEGLEILRRLG